jgi:hypothetical protein
MKSVHVDKQNRTSGRTAAPMRPLERKTNTSIHHHDSVIVSTLVVKEHGERLLIKLPEATPWLAHKKKIYNTSCVFASIFSFFVVPQEKQMQVSSD